MKKSLFGMLLAAGVGAAALWSSAANAAPVISYTTIAPDTYELGITFDLETTGFTLPTTFASLQAVQDFSFYGGNDDWTASASLNGNTGFVEIYFFGSTIAPSRASLFGFYVPTQGFDMTAYQTTTADARMWGDAYDISNRYVAVTVVDFSNPIQAVASSVPEPASAALAGLGLIALLACRRRNPGRADA